MEFVLITVGIVLIAILMEVFLFFWTNILRDRFDFILTKKDMLPDLDKIALEKYIEGSYDSELGWVRKPNTSKKDSFAGNKSYSINSLGSRTNPGNEKRKKEIISFGDSYTFCREVNDNETWQYFLGKIRKSNVLNFGVGNYGMDQAFLRFKREAVNFPEAKYVVMGVVPETIQRNLTCWKHYSEHGNTFGFKPRFKIKNGKLKLIKNPMIKSSNFYDIGGIIDEVNENDYFYDEFKRDVLKFPYSYNLILKNKLKLFLFSSGVFVFERLGINWRKISFLKTNRIKEDIQGRIEKKKALFENKEALDVTIGIVKEFSRFALEKKIVPVLMIMPQEDDLKYLIENKKPYYNDFIEKAREILPTIDFVDMFLNMSDPFSIFYKKEYSQNYTVMSGHYSDYGNLLVAQELNKVLNGIKYKKK